MVLLRCHACSNSRKNLGIIMLTIGTFLFFFFFYKSRVNGVELRIDQIRRTYDML